MNPDMEFVAPNTLGPFVLGMPLSELGGVVPVRIDPTSTGKELGNVSYSMTCEGREFATVDLRLGLIESVTSFLSFRVGEVEQIGSSLEEVSKAIGEEPGRVDTVEHENGDIVAYVDFPRAGLIVTIEKSVATSFCLYR